MMYRLLLRCLVYASPFLLEFGMVAWVDPYGLFGHDGPVSEALKEKNLYHSGRTMPFSNMIWKLIHFRRDPTANILLGDSRLSYFDTERLAQATGETYFNLGIPGGNNVTTDHLFRFADSLTVLHNVYVQVSFRGLEAGRNYDVYREPAQLLDKPYTYLYNRRVMECAGLDLLSALFPDRVDYDLKPPDHWQVVLDAERATAENFVQDTTVFADLEHMAQRCNAEGAKLVFVEYPTHPDIQHIMAEAGLGPQREIYLERLRGIAQVIDLDQPGMFPTDNTFWRDPMHLTVEAQRALIAHIWAPAQ